MRHPLLSILVALFIGVIAPLCCCQFAVLTGAACGEVHGVAAQPDSCCRGCSGDPTPRDEKQTPTDHDEHTPGECPSCPSCQGTAVGTGVKFEAKVSALDQQLHALATIALAVLWELPPLDARAAPSWPGWASNSPFLRANREALRWHCALLV